MTKKTKTYSAEFKTEAIKKISDNIGISMQILSNWHNKANQGKLVGI